MRWPFFAPRIGLLGALLLLTGGCAGITSRLLVQAPNTVPAFLQPKARVIVDFGGLRLTGFPLQTLAVGPARATLAYRVVESDDYGLQVTHATVADGRRPRQQVTIRATLPAAPVVPRMAPRGTIILLHGYGLSHTSLLPWALQLAPAGWRCVMVDLRGHGESSGERIFFGTVETMDLAQLLDTLDSRGQLVAPVNVLGESYGASLALRWAARDRRVKRVVALAPYPELAPAALNLRAEFAAWFPERWVRGALDRLPYDLRVKPDRLDPISFVPGRNIPALLVAGGEDRIAPPAAVARLRRAVSDAGDMLIVPDASHEGLGLRLDVLAAPVTDWFDGSRPAN